MSLAFQVAGYDKQTERLSISHPVPKRLVATARKMAHVEAKDDGEGAYPLDSRAAIALGIKMDRSLNPELYDWFLEPSQND